jgi:anthranilate/para-aminobenzoate synthase component I
VLLEGQPGVSGQTWAGGWRLWAQHPRWEWELKGARLALYRWAAHNGASQPLQRHPQQCWDFTNAPEPFEALVSVLSSSLALPPPPPWQPVAQVAAATTLTETIYVPPAFHPTWFGVVGYEFYRWCDPAFYSEIPQNHLTDVWPTLQLYGFDDVWAVSHAQPQMAWRCADVFADAVPRVEQDSPWATAAAPPTIHTPARQPCGQSLAPQAFEAAAQALLTDILAGRLYQANLSIQFGAHTQQTPVSLYQQLAQADKAPFSGFLQGPWGALVCQSPERLLQQDASGRLSSRPIAGTRGRGQSEAEEADIGRRLQANLKEQAEHRMLVDLIRNDLGRVCLPGSVHVAEQEILERYPHVTHLVSDIVGQRRPAAAGAAQASWHALRALFPGGTITGCPKIRAIQRLAEVEPVGRGWYTGSLGFIDVHSGVMDWNILIRSLCCHPANEAGGYPVVWHAGAGLVADSAPLYEYRECLRKAARFATLFDAAPQAV